MKNVTLDFSEFPPVSTEEWLAKIHKDLKGEDFENLLWQVEPGIDLEPFYRGEDIEIPAQVPQFHSDNNWTISETIPGETPKQIEKNLLDALANGVETPIVHYEDIRQLDSILKEVHLDYIQLFLEGPVDLDSFNSYLNLIKSKNLDPATLKGFFYTKISDIEKIKPLSEFAHKHFPSFRILPASATGRTPSEEIANAVYKGSEWIAQLSSPSLPQKEIARQVFFTVGLQKKYFVEICKIRALKIVWQQVLDAYGLPAIPPHIHAYIKESSYTEDINTNNIRCTTLAMSAVIGGVNSLNLRAPSPEQNANSRRIARNIQHILKMESFLDRVSDPVKGAYFFEMLTLNIAEKAWAIFQDMNK